MPIYAIYELLSTLLPSVSRNVHWPLISFKIVKENDGTPSLVWFGQVPAGSNKFQPGTLLKENRESFRLLPWQGPGSVLRVSVDVHDVPILRSCPATRQLDFPSKPTVPGKPTVPDTPTVPGNLVTQKPGNSETRQTAFPGKPNVSGKPTIPDTPTVPGNPPSPAKPRTRHSSLPNENQCQAPVLLMDVGVQTENMTIWNCYLTSNCLYNDCCHNLLLYLSCKLKMFWGFAPSMNYASPATLLVSMSWKQREKNPYFPSTMENTGFHWT